MGQMGQRLKGRLKLFQFTLIFFLSLCSFVSRAQSFEDKITNALEKKGKFFVRFDTKNSFIGYSKVKLFGINIGLDHDKTFKYGIGFHLLSDSIVREIENSENERILANLRFNYISIFGEYTFYKTKHWEASMPLQLGFGYTGFIENRENEYFFYNKKYTIHYEATLVGHYRFLRYFALGGGVGYRIMFLNNKQKDLHLTNPIYTIKFKVFLGDIYRDIVN